jgi:hypothetical protein
MTQKEHGKPERLTCANSGPGLSWLHIAFDSGCISPDEPPATLPENTFKLKGLAPASRCATISRAGDKQERPADNYGLAIVTSTASHCLTSVMGGVLRVQYGIEAKIHVPAKQKGGKHSSALPFVNNMLHNLYRLQITMQILFYFLRQCVANVTAPFSSFPAVSHGSLQRG